MRVRICWKPQFGGAVEAAARNMVRKNAWRLFPEYDFDEAMGEARFLFARIVKRYPAVREAPHFQTLYLNSLRNLITDLAEKRTKIHSRRETVTDEDGRQVFDPADPFDDSVETEFRMFLEELPPDLRALAVVIVREDVARPIGPRRVAKLLGVSRVKGQDLLTRMAGVLRELRPVGAGSAV